jgi:molecular chaperone GrpE
MNQSNAGQRAEEVVSAGSSEKSEPNEPRTAKGEVEKKPLEKMTKTELIQRATDLADAAEKNYDLYLRSQAEMENMRRRGQKEKEEWIKFSNESLIKQLLPALDALEQAVSHCTTTSDDCVEALKQGVELTLKGLKDALQKAGLEEVKAHGEAFDPNYHQAVSEMEDGSAEPGAVLHELQKGYLLNQRLLRPAMVIVNRKNQTSQNENDE